MIAALILSALAAAQDYTPSPYYSHAPPYFACSFDTPVSRALGTPSAILPLIKSSDPLTGNATVTGTITLVDGCSFRTDNFTYVNGKEAYWFGGFQDSNQGMILTSASVYPTNSTNMTLSPLSNVYTFMQTPGLQANYAGFNQFRLYDKSKNNLVAYANIPLSLTTARSAVLVTQNVDGSAKITSKASLPQLSLFLIVVSFSLLL